MLPSWVMQSCSRQACSWASRALPGIRVTRPCDGDRLQVHLAMDTERQGQRLWLLSDTGSLSSVRAGRHLPRLREVGRGGQQQS